MNDRAVAISLVIPAYNEEKYITPTLESIARARWKFEQTTGEGVEVIVVDNASTDRTAEIARSFGCTVVPFAKHQIAAVRNAGAGIASGRWIAFVDADRSIVPEDVFLEIAANLSDGRVYGGGTRFRPEHWNVRIFIAVMIAGAVFKLLGLGGVLYYLRRVDFESLGGWDESLYVAEDANLSMRMKRAARSSGRRIRNLRGRVSICVRKIHLLPTFSTAWHLLGLLVRWDFRSPKSAHRFFYDVDKLR